MYDAFTGLGGSKKLSTIAQPIANYYGGSKCTLMALKSIPMVFKIVRRSLRFLGHAVLSPREIGRSKFLSQTVAPKLSVYISEACKDQRLCMILFGRKIIGFFTFSKTSRPLSLPDQQDHLSCNVIQVFKCYRPHSLLFLYTST